eukprot:2754078-Rhodomonas_salina.1
MPPPPPALLPRKAPAIHSPVMAVSSFLANGLAVPRPTHSVGGPSSKPVGNLTVNWRGYLQVPTARGCAGAGQAILLCGSPGNDRARTHLTSTRSSVSQLLRVVLIAEVGCCAQVGTSGSGKSTVIQLIERFYDPAQGQVSSGAARRGVCADM